MKNPIHSTAMACLCLATACFIASTTAWATAYKSAATGTWETTTTWTPNGTPTTSDTVEIQSGHNVTVTSTTATAGGVTVDNGGTLSFGTSSTSGFTLTIAGNLVNNGTIMRLSSASSSPTHTITFGGVTGAYTWTGSGDISSLKGSVTISSGFILDISGLSTALKFASSGGSVALKVSGTLITGRQIINENGSTGGLTINAGATVQSANTNGLVNGTIGTFNWSTGAKTLNTAANWVFNGTNSQITLGLPATVNSLVISNAYGVTLSAAVLATNLTLTAGPLITSAANLLTLSPAATVTGASLSSFVKGPMAQMYVAAGAKSFPVGTNSNYRPVTVNITTLSGTPTITVTPKEPASFGGVAPSGYTVWSTRSWTVASSVTSGNVCALTVDGTDFTPVGSAAILGYDGSATTTPATSFATPAYSAAGINLTASSDFALGCPAPATPAITSVTAPSCSPVSVNWGAVSGASTYNVYRKLSGGAYGTALAAGQTGTSYSDTTAATGNTYVYAVSSVSPCGTESALSTDSTPVMPTGAPGQPAITSVTAGCDLTVNWGAVSGATSYNIYRKLSTDSSYSPIATGQTGTSYEDTAATDSTKTYLYEVSGVSACESALSAPSTGASPTTTAITAQPANYIGYEGAAATFTLAAQNATAYQWYVNQGSGYVPVNGAAGVNNGADGNGGTTASFTTAAATAAMNGYAYRCVATGACNASTSSSATLSLGAKFRSLTTGNWAANTSWQISADGASWVSAPSGVYPGAAAGHLDAVEIQTGHTITIPDSASNNAGAVTIDSGGVLYLNSLGVTNLNLGSYLYIGGNLVNNGSINGSVPGSGNQNYLQFTGNATWSGSGSLAGGKISLGVSSGVALTLQCDVSLRASTSKASVQINGTLYAGTHKFTQTGTSGSTFTLGAGATLETANTGGIGGTGGSTGLWQSTVGTLSLSPAANYIFDGTAAQAAGAGFPATVNNLTINNTGASGNNTVTLAGVAVSGVLYVESGLLSFGSVTTSTAGALTFDGQTFQAVGSTWGSTSSSAANQDSTHFADSGYVTVAGFSVVYNSNGGTGTQTDPGSPYGYDSVVTVLGPGSVARSGFAFAGWDTVASGLGTQYSAGSTFNIVSNVTLYAQWSCTAPAITGGIDAPATSLCAGSPLVLTLTNASGTSPLSYQWQTNGVAILNATNAAYDNLAVALADAGNYACVVANGCGAVTSAVVAIAVNAAPAITDGALPAGIYGTAYNHTVGATGATGFSATGLPPGLVLDSSSGVISGTPTAAGTSNVMISVTSAAGCSASVTLGLTVQPAGTSVGVSSSENPSGYRDLVSFGAMLPADATGSVVFFSAAGPISTNTLVAGNAASPAIASLPRGTDPITVVYGGDNNYLGSTNLLNQIVTNHPPVANPATYTIYAGMNQLKISLAQLLMNASDADGDTIALSSVSASTNGVTVSIGSGALTYAIANPVNDQFTYTVNDGFGGTASGTVTIVASANSVFGQTSPAISTAGGLASLTFAGIPGSTYSVQRSTNLVDWATQWTTNAPASGVFTWTDDFTDLGLVPDSAYYRLEWQP